MRRNPLLIPEIKGLAQVSGLGFQRLFIYSLWFRDCSLVIRFYKFPNIAGTSLLAGFVTPQSGDICGTGPFSNMQRWVQNFVVTDGSDSSVLEFDASLANAQYGAADTVQPSALRSLVLIRAF